MFASAATVIAALLCLTIAKVNGTSGLGPIAAMGVACAALSMLTLLPGAAHDLRPPRVLAVRAAHARVGPRPDGAPAGAARAAHRGGLEALRRAAAGDRREPARRSCCCRS